MMVPDYVFSQNDIQSFDKSIFTKKKKLTHKQHIYTCIKDTEAHADVQKHIHTLTGR